MHGSRRLAEMILAPVAVVIVVLGASARLLYRRGRDGLAALQIVWTILLILWELWDWALLTTRWAATF